MAIPLTGIMVIATMICGILAIISYYIKLLPLYRKAANFPGPPTLPILGSAHLFFGNTADIMNKPSEPVLSRQYNMTILLSNNAAEKESMYKFARPWIGTGLVTAPAAKSRIHRKLIIPTFNSKILDTFVDIFNKQSAILSKQLEKQLGKSEFGIFDYVSLCTLDIICETAMGVSINAQTGTDTKYIDAVKRQLEILYLRMFRIWLHWDFIFNLTKLGKDQRTCVKYLHSVTNDVIHKKQDALKKAAQGEKKTIVPEQTATKKTKAFLDLMMELTNDGQKLTDEELREEVDTTIVAGNDTAATVMNFTVMLLANFPEIQEKVYQELYKIYGEEISSEKPIDKADLDHMDYLERVLKESMRLFPPAQILARSVTGDIKIDDKTIPEGCSIALSAFHLHRSEKYWPDPLKFDPDRFLPEEVAKRHPYCYIPFSGGPRSCIGQKYAFMTLKIMLATILRRYVFIKDKPVKIQDVKLKADILLKPVEPLTVRIIERTFDTKYQSTIDK